MNETTYYFYPEYAGMSYETASRAAAGLLSEAASSGSWTTDLPERLVFLRNVMARARVAMHHERKPLFSAESERLDQLAKDIEILRRTGRLCKACWTP